MCEYPLFGTLIGASKYSLCDLWWTLLKLLTVTLWSPSQPVANCTWSVISGYVVAWGAKLILRAFGDVKYSIGMRVSLVSLTWSVSGALPLWKLFEGCRWCTSMIPGRASGLLCPN